MTSGFKGEPWVFAITAASAGAVLISIAAAQILLTLACILWVVFRPKGISWPGYTLPLCVFMLATTISLLLSPEPELGTGPIRKFVLFSMGLLAANFVTTAARARMSHRLLLGIAAGTAVVAIVQFGLAYRRYLTTQQLADDPTVLARITGLMSHWMTFSGEQLLVWCAGIPALLVLGRRWLLPIAMVGASLVLSFTRSVWLGAVAGFILAAVALPRRLVLGVLLPVLLIAMIGSGLIYHRISKSLEQNFAPDSGRLALFSAGIQMIQDHPLFGVGPERIAREFPGYYRGHNLNGFYYGHLHNNILQIAAERGLLCLAAFLWFVFQLYADLGSMFKRADAAAKWTALSALSALTGFLIAGLFEYNFGDSEVLLLLLFVVSIPYGMKEHPGIKPAATR
jgi:O-antigen ligase